MHNVKIRSLPQWGNFDLCKTRQVMYQSKSITESFQNVILLKLSDWTKVMAI